MYHGFHKNMKLTTVLKIIRNVSWAENQYIIIISGSCTEDWILQQIHTENGYFK